MSAYIVCDVTVKDRNTLREYLELSEHTLAQYGGKFLVQAGEIEVIEGDWNPKVIVIAEFPSMEKAKQWYQSNTYAKALSVKSKAMDRNMILVNGIL
ncbi:MAG: DUF1330 domain-containing protein [Gammaproteobacteria bacterium]|nr:DUF1330 domain-containing protein [Gammaproteobacteria bacterium]